MDRITLLPPSLLKKLLSDEHPIVHLFSAGHANAMLLVALARASLQPTSDPFSAAGIPSQHLDQMLQDLVKRSSVQHPEFTHPRYIDGTLVLVPPTGTPWPDLDVDLDEAQPHNTRFWLMAALLRLGANPWIAPAPPTDKKVVLASPAQVMAFRDWRGLCHAAWHHPDTPSWSSLLSRHSETAPWSRHRHLPLLDDPTLLRFWLDRGLPPEALDDRRVPLLHSARSAAAVTALMEAGALAHRTQTPDGLGPVESWVIASPTPLETHKYIGDSGACSPRPWPTALVPMVAAVLPQLLANAEDPRALAQLRQAPWAALRAAHAAALVAWAELDGQPAALGRDGLGLLGHAALAVLSQPPTTQPVHVLRTAAHLADQGRVDWNAWDIQLAFLATLKVCTSEVHQAIASTSADGWRFILEQSRALGPALFSPADLLKAPAFVGPATATATPRRYLRSAYLELLNGFLVKQPPELLADLFPSDPAQAFTAIHALLCAFSQEAGPRMASYADQMMERYHGHLPAFLLDCTAFGGSSNQPVGLDRILEILQAASRSLVPPIAPCKPAARLMDAVTTRPPFRSLALSDRFLSWFARLDLEANTPSSEKPVPRSSHRSPRL